MSNTQPHEEHHSPIKTPKQLIVTIVLSFILPVIIIILLVNLVTTGDQVGAGSNTLTPEAIQKRIAPVAKLDLVDASGPKVFKTGVQVYKAACAGCHDAGAAAQPGWRWGARGDGVPWPATRLHRALWGPDLLCHAPRAGDRRPHGVGRESEGGGPAGSG